MFEDDYNAARRNRNEQLAAAGLQPLPDDPAENKQPAQRPIRLSADSDPSYDADFQAAKASRNRQLAAKGLSAA